MMNERDKEREARARFAAMQARRRLAEAAQTYQDAEQALTEMGLSL